MPRRRIVRPQHPTLPAVEAVLAAPAFKYHGDRKYARNVRVTYPTLPTVDLAALGYKNPESKLKQLRRHYLSDAEMDRAAALLRTRQARGSDLTSVGISFRGQPKTQQGTQGWCIESMAVVVAGRERHATVFYRQAELILKFAADLVFLREVFDRLEVVPTSIEFHFAVAWVGMMFLPSLFQSVSPIAFLERLRSEDHALWMSATWYLNRYVTNTPVKRASADKQGRFLLTTMSEGRLIALREYLREHGRASTRPDSKSQDLLFFDERAVL